MLWFGDAECLEVLADALEDLQYRGLPRLTGELGAGDPGGSARLASDIAHELPHIPLRHQLSSRCRNTWTEPAPAQVHHAVSAEGVNRAARVIDHGLRLFASVTRDTGQRPDALATSSK